jgi:hypothetical protein
MSKTTNKFAPEVRERAVRMALVRRRGMRGLEMFAQICGLSPRPHQREKGGGRQAFSLF